MRTADAVALFAGFVLAPSGLASPEQDAETLLRRALERQRKVDCLMLQTRASAKGLPETLVKSQTLADKGITVQILLPISMQGMVSYDDTKRLHTYYPDPDVVVVQPSPMKFQPSIDWRMRRVKANYSLRRGGSDRIAGRQVVEIILKPAHDSMPSRRLFLDAEHDVVLRYVVDGSDGPTEFFDTKGVTFDRRKAVQDFGLPPEAAESPRRSVDGPQPLKRLRDARSVVGFTPREPKDLPYGFAAFATQVVKVRGRAKVATRISDGMASLTVYQYRGEPMAGPTQTDRFGLNFTVEPVFGDPIPDEVMRRVLEAFVKGSR